MPTIPVLLAGGIGSRLWPMSTASRPKQLQALFGSHTMIQETLLRLVGLATDPPIIVCNAEHATTIDADLRQVGVEARAVIAEPIGRSTAPAVAAAALLSPPEAVLLVLPADHLMADGEAFRRAAGTAVEAARAGGIVTFGVVPNHPETGYGYIQADAGPHPVAEVVAFFEKPDSARAAEYLAAGFLWNSGMFAFQAGVILADLRRFEPALVEAVEQSLEGTDPSERIVVPGSSFGRAATISIDHAVMERTNRAMVVPLDAGWSDVGSWATLYEVGEKDAEQNVTRGDVIAIDTTGSYVRSTSRTVAVVGLDDVVVVETPQAVLVVRLDRAQDVKAVVEELGRRADRA